MRRIGNVYDRMTLLPNHSLWLTDFLEVQETAVSQLCARWLKDGFETRAEDWRIVVWIGYQPLSLQLRREASCKKINAQWKLRAKARPGSPPTMNSAPDLVEHVLSDELSA